MTNHITFTTVKSTLLVICMCLLASSQVLADDLASVRYTGLVNDWAAVQRLAQSQADNNQTRYKSTEIEDKVFEGTYTPDRNQVKLAILSDDGVDVYVNDQLVLDHKGENQHAPNLGESLKKIPFDLVKDQQYRIKVEYSNTVYKQNATDYDGASLYTYFGSCEVTEVSPTDATKVLISTKHDDAYPTTAQTEDGKITVTAKVRNAEVGQKVYFEVIDPRDASSYNQSQDPNDNSDTTKSGSQAYATFQTNCLSAQQVQIGSPNTRQIAGDVWEVKTTLTITNRYAGDNYQVRATGDRPLDTAKYFDKQPTDWGGSFQTSGLLVAWRRLYLQLHRMYKKGATITANFTPDADNNPDILAVDNTADFKKDDVILLWNRDFPVVETTVTNVVSATSLEVTDVPASTVTMPTGTTFPQFFPTYSGVRLKNSSETFDDVTRRLFPNAYGGDAAGNDGGIFSDFVELQGWDVPKYTNFPNTGVGTDFCARWFKYGSNNSNMFQLLAANQATGFSGVALLMNNTATVCLGQDSPAFHEEASVHEIGHLCDLTKERPIISDHVDQAVRKQVHSGHTGTESCVMSYVDQTTGITEFDIDCIRHARSQPDPQ